MARRPRRAKKANPEQRLQIEVATYLDANLRQDVVLWTAFPAGGGGMRRGALLKLMGLKRGWPDLLFIWKSKSLRLSVAGVELKSNVGRQSPSQQCFQETLVSMGGCYYVARSLDEVVGFLTGLSVLK